MNAKEKEFIKALHVVKDYCTDRNSCSNPSRCPLYGYCPESPDYWPELPEIEEEERRE